MNNEELIKENTLLKEEYEKLKKQLENYNNSRNSYYEKNKETVNKRLNNDKKNWQKKGLFKRKRKS
jgi:hypothetical protein